MVQTDEERKAKIREYNKRYKARVKAYNQRPEIKAKTRERNKRSNARPENKAKRKEYDQRPEIKAKRKAHAQRPESKAKAKEYRQRPENKAKRKAHDASPNVKQRKKISRYSNRLKVLQTYSKRFSNSGIPCCNCCGENSHIGFLVIDHIAGRRQMDSEPELIKLGYSSKLDSKGLVNWILHNDFPEGFQILCHNCNLAKRTLKNNYECPMKNKPH